jgi:type VI protein secretion system component Hcp
MATSLFLKVDGIQGTVQILSYQNAFGVSTFEMRSPIGGVGIQGGPPGELTVTMEGGIVLSELSQAFAAKRVFPNAWLIIDQGGEASIEFAYTSLTVVGISGIADEDGAEYQVTFAYQSVKPN